jgi:Ni/Co efflux regulator RcnB
MNKACSRIIPVLLAGFFVASPALAEKPDNAGNGKAKQSQKQNGKSHDKHGTTGKDFNRGDGKVDLDVNVYFGERQRTAIREYYHDEFSKGHCPPGLAKKHNGCMPPGQAKKWKKGEPLPRDVVYYELPHSIVIEMGTPPAGYKYVRVAKDILLIAIGTSMVVDAIEDLGNM